MTDILLGYKVPTAEPVNLPLHHLIVTGMTRLSGKTTTLEALTSRSGMKTLTFRTKRGELGFEDAKQLPIFFDPRGLSHWKSLEGLLSATMAEKVGRQPGVRPALIRLCEGTPTIEEIQQRIYNKIHSKKVSAFTLDVYTNINAYLDLVIPQLASIKYSDKLELTQGTNMIDLVGLSTELQGLILQSVLKFIYEHESNLIVVIPEAWKFVPQDTGSPVKHILDTLVREGAASGIFIWFDSQDLRGIDKQPLRQVDNWILGRQRSELEVDATLGALPLPSHQKPDPDKVQTLEVGHFYACLHNDVFLVYVQPRWMSAEQARKVAMGEATPTPQLTPLIRTLQTNDSSHLQREVETLKEKLEQAHVTATQLEKEHLELKTRLAVYENQVKPTIEDLIRELIHQEILPLNLEAKTNNPIFLNIEKEELTIKVNHIPITKEYSTKVQQGQILYVLSVDLKDKASRESQIQETLSEHGWNIDHNSLAPGLATLVNQGLIIKEKQSDRSVTYRLPKNVRFEASE